MVEEFCKVGASGFSNFIDLFAGLLHEGRENTGYAVDGRHAGHSSRRDPGLVSEACSAWTVASEGREWLDFGQRGYERHVKTSPTWEVLGAIEQRGYKSG